MKKLPTTSDIMSFINPKFGEVRASLDSDAKPLFCLADICHALGLSNPSVVKYRLKKKGISSTKVLTAGGTQQLLYINEPNLYRCIFQSRKPEAETFQDWVVEDVLPELRRKGSYSGWVETFHSSKDTCSVGELAKFIDQGGYPMGQQRLFAWMRDNGYLCSRGENRNIPRQRYLNQKLFEVKKTSYTDEHGVTHHHTSPRVTTKGQQYFLTLFANHQPATPSPKAQRKSSTQRKNVIQQKSAKRKSSTQR